MRFQASVLALCFVFFSTTAALATPGENHRLVRTPVDGRSLVARGSEDDDEQRYQGKCKKQKVVYRKEWSVQASDWGLVVGADTDFFQASSIASRAKEVYRCGSLPEIEEAGSVRARSPGNPIAIR